MTYYLKYRPQSLKDLIGQDHVVSQLQSALEKERLAHAYLLTGPRGVGKTSTARILAKMINCPKGGEDNCDICQSITDGSCLDLMEIDAASNRGIDDIRDLREKIKLSPTSLKKKVYIIDEVHMLTTEAFNALLKTLEEPPSHVLFILATTEVHKIPATILSRVTRLDFKAASVEDMVKALTKVVDREKLKVDDEALSLIAKRAEGSYRDGVKFLDQLSSQEKVTLELVENLFKGGSSEVCGEIIKALAERDAKKGLEILAQEVARGTNLKELLISLMDYLRSVLLSKHGLDSGQSQNDRLTGLSDKFSTEELLKDLEHFQKAYEALKYTAIQELPLEIAVVESCQVETIEKVEDGSLKVVVEGRDSKVEKETEEIHLPVSTIKTPPSIIQYPSSNDDFPNSSPDSIKLKDRWSYVIETVTLDNFSLGAMLKAIKLAGVEDNRVILKVPYSFHQRILETPRNRDLLESVMGDVLGQEIKIMVVLEQRPIQVEELQNVELAADDEVIRIAAEIFSSES